MIPSVVLILIVLAFFLALAEAFSLFARPGVRWGWLAIAFWFLSMLIGQVRL